MSKYAVVTVEPVLGSDLPPGRVTGEVRGLDLDVALRAFDAIVRSTQRTSRHPVRVARLRMGGSSLLVAAPSDGEQAVGAAVSLGREVEAA